MADLVYEDMHSKQGAQPKTSYLDKCMKNSQQFFSIHSNMAVILFCAHCQMVSEKQLVIRQ